MPLLANPEGRRNLGNLACVPTGPELVTAESRPSLGREDPPVQLVEQRLVDLPVGLPAVGGRLSRHADRPAAHPLGVLPDALVTGVPVRGDIAALAA